MIVFRRPNGDSILQIARPSKNETGVYLVAIKASLELFPDVAPVYFEIKVLVYEVQVKIDPYVVIPMSATATDRGVIEVRFNDTFVLPKYASDEYELKIQTFQRNSSIIYLSVFDMESLVKKNLNFTWQISNLTSSSIQFRVTFEKPQEVSASSADGMNVYIRTADHLVTKTGS